MSSEQKRQAICRQVARILRDERQKQGLSMEALAQRAGLSQAMISFVEREERNPTLDTLLRLADALRIDLADVLHRAQS